MKDIYNIVTSRGYKMMSRNSTTITMIQRKSTFPDGGVGLERWLKIRVAILSSIQPSKYTVGAKGVGWREQNIRR